MPYGAVNENLLRSVTAVGAMVAMLSGIPFAQAIILPVSRVSPDTGFD
jgi:hypothetical protein